MALKFEIEQNGVIASLPPPMQMFLLSEGTTVCTAINLAAELGIADLDHDRAVSILRNCRRAITPTGRLLLIETVIPGPDEPHAGKIMDFVMLLGLGGQERTEQQWPVARGGL